MEICISKSYIFIVFTLLYITAKSYAETFYLQHGAEIKYNPYDEHKQKLQVYCYPGKPKYIIYLWQSVSLELDIKKDDYSYYEGDTPNEVLQKYLEHQSSWNINLLSWKEKNFKLDPFKRSCIGIDSNLPYTVLLKVMRIDYWKVLLLIGGITLFYLAKSLSRNIVFYYICGISFGVCASFLILIYFISKLFPQKPMMYGVAIGGWAVGVYILQFLWENVRTILINYQMYILWYTLSTALISFIVCYRLGPVTNERTKNLIRWFLQSIGLISVFCSSHFQEAAMAQVILILVVFNVPKSWISKSRTYWKRKFPPKVKLLTNAEYYHQGVTETSKALDNLRTYCSSPECNQWKTALKLKDVKRFASFVEGNSHLSDEEILEYEYSVQTTDITDDEDITDEDY